MEPSGEPAEPAEPAEQAENEADGDVQKMSKNQLKRLRWVVGARTVASFRFSGRQLARGWQGVCRRDARPYCRRQEMSKAARQYEKARKKAKQQEAREQRQQQLEARLQALGCV